jgi:hypothetical protein
LHHEAIYWKGYHRPAGQGCQKDPWEGNLAMTNVVFDRLQQGELERKAGLTVVHREVMSFFDFQLAGGFRPKAAVPYSIFRQVIKLDRMLGPLMKGIGFRLFLVLEKVEKE